MSTAPRATSRPCLHARTPGQGPWALARRRPPRFDEDVRTAGRPSMIEVQHAEAFLRLPRLAVVGASDDPPNFGRTIYRELRGAGRDVVAVHPTATTVDGDPCHPDLASVPGELDGVIVM